MRTYEDIEREKKEKEKFEEVTKKQLKGARTALTSVFCIMGGIFLVMGIVLLALGIVDEEGFQVGIVFAPMGLFFMILTVILNLTLPKSYSYEAYKKRLEKFGAQNYYDQSVATALLDARVKELEERVEELEYKIRNMK